MDWLSFIREVEVYKTMETLGILSYRMTTVTKKEKKELEGLITEFPSRWTWKCFRYYRHHVEIGFIFFYPVYENLTLDLFPWVFLFVGVTWVDAHGCEQTQLGVSFYFSLHCTTGFLFIVFFLMNGLSWIIQLKLFLNSQ